jgi:hypothetical protein
MGVKSTKATLNAGRPEIVVAVGATVLVGRTVCAAVGWLTAFPLHAAAQINKIQKKKFAILIFAEGLEVKL